MYNPANQPHKTLDVAGIGNALVDALVVMDERALLARHDIVRGHMTLVDHERWLGVFGEVQEHGVEIQSGGSGANTIAALGFLGAKAVFCGQVGDDDFGRLYEDRMVESCGQHALNTAPAANTGKCLSVISEKDAERTMLTDLGAAVAMEALGGFAAKVAEARVLHVEGYLLHPGPMTDRAHEAMGLAAANGTVVSLDAADPSVVAGQRDAMWQIIKNHCGIVFLNEEEATTLVQGDVETALERIGAVCETVVVKLGKKGSLIRHKGETVRAGVQPVEAVDTTGAGDSYAAGFLYGYTRGWDAGRCADLAARVASLTVSQVGAVVRDRGAMEAAKAAVVDG